MPSCGGFLVANVVAASTVGDLAPLGASFRRDTELGHRDGQVSITDDPATDSCPAPLVVASRFTG
jgi:hypothetical protein